jgi:DNA mismatch endonuclease (patch repair protein)
MDPLTQDQRSERMRRVRQRGTTPEMTVRRRLHAMGFRYGLHRRDLPGRPDIVLTRHRAAVFVHGCFWHSHPGCRLATVPKSRTEYWDGKLEENRRRDARALEALEGAGWRVLVVWECETRSPQTLQEELAEFLLCSPPPT